MAVPNETNKVYDKQVEGGADSSMELFGVAAW